MTRIIDTTAEIAPDGWERIGQVCSAGRRSLWMRLTRIDESSPYDDSSNVSQIELCAGREGDDDYLVITRDNPQFARLLDLFLCARFAVQT